MGTVTVCSKLPWDFKAEFNDKAVVFAGAKGRDITGEPVLLPGFGMTPGVDADWYAGWEASVGDFAALKNGVIFSSAPNKVDGEAKEMATAVTSGLEQKSPDALGVEVVTKDD